MNVSIRSVTLFLLLGVLALPSRPVCAELIKIGALLPLTGEFAMEAEEFRGPTAKMEAEESADNSEKMEAEEICASLGSLGSLDP